MKPERTFAIRQGGYPGALASLLGILTLGALLVAGTARGEDLDAFLKKLQSENGDERQAAWEGAAPQGSRAVLPLVALASGENRDAALAALRSLDAIVHSSAAPGSTTRKEVAAALAAILGDEKVKLPLKVTVKQHVLDLLGSVGEDEEVPAIRKALQDTEIRDFARKALQRIPGDAAAKALMDATSGATGEWLDALLITVGTKRAACCIPELAKIAESRGAGSVAAAMALARIADEATVPVVINVVKWATPPARGLLTDDLVRMGDLIREKGNAQLAGRIYASVLARAEDDAPRYAALYALSGMDSKENFPIFMDAVGDRSAAIRKLAVECLEKWGGVDVDKALFEQLAGSQGRKKATLLRVLAGRKAPGVEKNIQDALGDTDIDVKVTALDLAGKLGDSSNEGALAEAFEKGSPAVKEVALDAYLNIADARAASDAGAAEKMYLRAMDAATDPVTKGRAIVGLGATANPEVLPRIKEARKSPELAQSANQAYVAFAKAMGKAGKKDEAVEMLLEVLTGGAGRETIRSALAGLKELGGDPTAFQKKQGLLASWYLVGPFPNEGGKGFDTEYSPEKDVNLKVQVDHKGRERKWEEYYSPNLDGKVDLRTVFQRSNDVCAYAYAEIEVPEAMDVKFKIGSDDGVICWLNGKRILATNATRGLSPDQDVVDARVEAGVNKILLKITQGGGEWEFMFRVTDRADVPLDLTKFKFPMKK